MDQSIGDILSGDEPEPTPVEEVAEQVEEQPEAQADGPVRDEKGRFAPKEPTGVENEPQPEVAAEPVPPTEQTNQLPPAEYAALRDERRKRQEAEARAAAIEAHYAQLARQQQAQPQQPPVDFWDDPQSFMESRFSKFSEELFQQFEQKQQIQRINASENAAKSKYADYSEAYSAFEQAVQLNPRLAYELAQAPDPGEFAYSKGKTALAIQNTGSIDALRAQIRAEIEAEAKAAFNPAPVRLPSTTAADGSVGGRSGPAWSGPASITDILR